MQLRANIAIGITDYYKPGKYFHVSVQAELKPEKFIFKMPQQIFVLANVRGDFSRLAKTLIRKRVIDHQLQWIYGDGHVVILGEVLNGDVQGLESLWLIYSLEEKARQAGGCVHFIPGVQEYRALSEKGWHGLHPVYASKFSLEGSPLPGAALYNGNFELIRWLRTKRCYLQLGDVLIINGLVLCKLVNSASPWSDLASTSCFGDFVMPDLSDHCAINEQISVPIHVERSKAIFNTVAYEMGDQVMQDAGCNILIFEWEGHTGLKALNSKIVTPHTDQVSGPVCIWGRKGKFYQLLKGGKYEELAS